MLAVSESIVHVLNHSAQTLQVPACTLNIQDENKDMEGLAHGVGGLILSRYELSTHWPTESGQSLLGSQGALRKGS